MSAKQRPKKSLRPPNKDGVRWHKVFKKQTLGRIAKRYGVSVQAIRGANGITKRAPIIPGQQLIIPSPKDLDGLIARKLLDKGPPAKREARPKKRAKTKVTWAVYRRRPRQRDQVHIIGRQGIEWKGTTLTKQGRVRSSAKKAFKRVLATADGEKIAISPRIIELITRVSNEFGGRTIKVVSGYRLGKTSKTSRHRHGKAMDFIVVNVPNKAVRDFVKTFDRVGVGYYPNSHFVHLDVRKQWTYWIDYAGPGQAPRYAGFWTR